MERTGIISLSDSAVNPCLTPASGHKFEILEAVINTDATDDAILADYVKIGGSYLLTAWITHEVAGAASLRIQHTGLVVYAGEEYGLIPVGGGSIVYGLVTYIDVDYTT